eukprot:8869796-Ditylum_brightwellii.AAC.1
MVTVSKTAVLSPVTTPTKAPQGSIQPFLSAAFTYLVLTASHTISLPTPLPPPCSSKWHI